MIDKSYGYVIIDEVHSEILRIALDKQSAIDYITTFLINNYSDIMTRNAEEDGYNIEEDETSAITEYIQDNLEDDLGYFSSYIFCTSALVIE